jgi:glyoxylase-like metal-dependent hydrolase (beta-lactamase superfamily II)
MTKHVDAATLQSWLEEKRPVTIVDVRSSDDRAQWSIPGSIHVDAYEALKSGNPVALSGVPLPADAPIVTVCNLGRMSDHAAAELSARGLDAASLTGGMKAWSLAWNTAELALARAHVTQVRRTGKGCLSYVISSSDEAAVIDASLAPDVYVGLAERHRVRIRYVLDTHIHADHLSRSRRLAEAVGAELLLPSHNRVQFPHRPVFDGDVIELGDVKIAAIATPGHTMESTSCLLEDEALFTGDTLFVAGVGRPDLHAETDAARERARLLFHSLGQILALGRNVLILPGHASEPIPFDGNPVAARLGEVADKLSDWLSSEERFVERILQRIPPTPPNYTRIVELNEAGVLPESDPTDLEAGANRCAVS